MKTKLILFLGIFFGTSVYSQHVVNTGNLDVVEKNANQLNKMHNEIAMVLNSKIKEYDLAVSELAKAQSMAYSLVQEKVNQSAEGIQLKNKRSALISENNQLYKDYDSWNNTFKARVDEMKNQNNKEESTLGEMDNELKGINTTLAILSASANIAESTYKRYGNTSSLQNYQRAVDNYNIKSAQHNALLELFNIAIDKHDNLEKERNAEIDKGNKERDERYVTLSKKNETNLNYIMDLDLRLKTLYGKAFEAENLKDPYWGAKKSSDIISAFGNGKYNQYFKDWLKLGFSIGRIENPRTGDLSTNEANVISNNVSSEYKNIIAMIKEFESLYFKTIFEYSTNKVVLDNKEVTDLSLFKICLTGGKKLETFKGIFKLKDCPSCVDFYSKTLTMESVKIDPSEYRIDDIGFIKLLPSLKELDIRNNSVWDFQPLGDTEYKGWVNISGNPEGKNDNHLKEVCKTLHKLYGTDCIYK